MIQNNSIQPVANITVVGTAKPPFEQWVADLNVSRAYLHSPSVMLDTWSHLQEIHRQRKESEVCHPA